MILGVLGRPKARCGRVGQSAGDQSFPEIDKAEGHVKQIETDARTTKEHRRQNSRPSLFHRGRISQPIFSYSIVWCEVKGRPSIHFIEHKLARNPILTLTRTATTWVNP